MGVVDIGYELNATVVYEEAVTETLSELSSIFVD